MTPNDSAQTLRETSVRLTRIANVLRNAACESTLCDQTDLSALCHEVANAYSARSLEMRKCARAVELHQALIED